MNKNKPYLVNLFITLTVCFIISSLIIYYDLLFFTLTENQLLYSYSTIAQVTGGIFGLTLTAYIFFNSNIQKIKNTDYLYDSVEAILISHHKSLIKISILTGIIIILSISGIYN